MGSYFIGFKARSDVLRETHWIKKLSDAFYIANYVGRSERSFRNSRIELSIYQVSISPMLV